MFILCKLIYYNHCVHRMQSNISFQEKQILSIAAINRITSTNAIADLRKVKQENT